MNKYYREKNGRLGIRACMDKPDSECQAKKEHRKIETGYWIFPEYRGLGIVPEAMTEVFKYGFNKMNLHSIEAVIDPGNTVSRKILQKFNFIKEGYFKENFYYEGKFYDSEVYSLLKQ